MNYYYLLPSLPELDAEDCSLSRDQFDDIIALISRNLVNEDLVVMNCLFHKHDNHNLLYVLFNEYHDFEISAFNRPMSVPVQVLKNYRRAFSSLPNYMMNYLNDFSGTFSSMTMREMEQRLELYFNDYLNGLNHIFLKTFFSWNFQLTQALAEANLKSFHSVKSKNDSSEPFFSGKLTLHGVTAPTEIVTHMQPLMESMDLYAIERMVNKYYWQFADSWREPFSAEQVFAYLLKVIRWYWWKGLNTDAEIAKTYFEQMVDEIKNKESSPKMPVT